MTSTIMEAADSSTAQVCTKCGVEKSLDDFHNRPAGKNGKRRDCKVCVRQTNNTWHQNNLTVRRNEQLQRRYGISVERYTELLVEQNGLCAICREVCPTGQNLAVDHDHETGEVRGLLCRPCNLGMGNLGDDPDRLLAAAAYLIRGEQS